MTASSFIFMLLTIALGVTLYYQNPEIQTISLGMLEITATTGVLCISAMGMGVLAGVLAMLTSDVPRIRRLRAIDE